MGEQDAAQAITQITGWASALAWMIASVAAMAGVALARRARVPLAGPGALAAGVVVLAATALFFSLLDLVAELGLDVSLWATVAMTLDLLATLACAIGLARLKRPPMEPAS